MEYVAHTAFDEEKIEQRIVDTSQKHEEGADPEQAVRMEPGHAVLMGGESSCTNGREGMADGVEDGHAAEIVGCHACQRHDQIEAP